MAAQDDGPPDMGAPPPTDADYPGEVIPITRKPRKKRQPRDPALSVPKTSTLGALCDILRSDDGNVLLGEKLEWDELKEQVTLGRRPLVDVDVAKLRERVEKAHVRETSSGGTAPLAMSKDAAFDAISIVARERSFHPVRERLESFEWDRVERLENVTDVVKCEATPINRTMLRRWLISCVARVYEPGCKVDTVLILIGDQGFKKSTFFELMALEEDWYAGSSIEIGTDDGVEKLAGLLIYELQELESLRKREWSAIKAFTSDRNDKIRTRYDRNHHRHKRDGVLVGTTNDPEVLGDDTGSRRFWVVRVEDFIDLAAVREQREQWWAEAKAAYKSGEQWWLTDAEEAQLVAHQSQFAVTDIWDSSVAEWLADNGHRSFELVEVLKGCFRSEMTLVKVGRQEQLRMASILRRMGYNNRPANGKRSWRKNVAKEGK